MEDLKPLLRRDASEIVSASTQGLGSLSELVAKTASQKGYSEEIIRRLVAETNKTFLEKTAQTDFPLAQVEEVFEALYSSPANLTKVAYTYPEYERHEPNFDWFEKSASLTQSNNEKPDDFRHVYRELARKETGRLQHKRASLHQASKDSYEKASNNIAFLKTLGYSETELHDSLNSKGVSTDVCKYASDIYKNISKSANTFVNRAHYETESYLEGVKESLVKFASEFTQFQQTDKEYIHAKKMQDEVYKQARILI